MANKYTICPGNFFFTVLYLLTCRYTCFFTVSRLLLGGLHHSEWAGLFTPTRPSWPFINIYLIYSWMMNISEGLASQLWCDEKQQGNFQPQYSKETGYINMNISINMIYIHIYIYINMNKISICQEYLNTILSPDLTSYPKRLCFPSGYFFPGLFLKMCLQSHWVWDLVSCSPR